MLHSASVTRLYAALRGAEKPAFDAWARGRDGQAP